MIQHLQGEHHRHRQCGMYLFLHHRDMYDLMPFILNLPLVEPKRVAVSSTPTLRPQPLLASELGDPWFSGPKAVMQVQRPIASQLQPDPWTSRPQPVPGRARGQPKGIVIVPVVRGQSIIPVPRMAVPKSTPSSSRDCSMSELRTFSASELRGELRSSAFQLNELWEMKHKLINVGEVEYEVMHIMNAK